VLLADVPMAQTPGGAWTSRLRTRNANVSYSDVDPDEEEAERRLAEIMEPGRLSVQLADVGFESLREFVRDYAEADEEFAADLNRFLGRSTDPEAVRLMPLATAVWRERMRLDNKSRLAFHRARSADRHCPPELRARPRLHDYAIYKAPVYCFDAVVRALFVDHVEEVTDRRGREEARALLAPQAVVQLTTQAGGAYFGRITRVDLGSGGDAGGAVRCCVSLWAFVPVLRYGGQRNFRDVRPREPAGASLGLAPDDAAEVDLVLPRGMLPEFASRFGRGLPYDRVECQLAQKDGTAQISLNWVAAFRLAMAQFEQAVVAPLADCVSTRDLVPLVLLYTGARNFRAAQAGDGCLNLCALAAQRRRDCLSLSQLRRVSRRHSRVPGEDEKFVKVDEASLAREFSGLGETPRLGRIGLDTPSWPRFLELERARASARRGQRSASKQQRYSGGGGSSTRKRTRRRHED